MSPKIWYDERLAETTSQLDSTCKQIRNISLLRIILFLTTIATILLLWDESASTIIFSAACTFIPFLCLLKVHNTLFNRKQWLEVKADLLRKELKCLQNDFSDFEDGKEFIDPQHKYSFDLDVFGKKSLFQSMNRTCTQVGKSTLANWMNEHLRNKQEIEERQSCIQELSTHNKFREEFSIIGKIRQTHIDDEMDIKAWAASTDRFTNSTRAKILIWGVPATNLLFFIAGCLNILSFNWFGCIFFGFIIFSFSVVKRAGILQEEYAEKLSTLSTYAQLISLCENQPWETPQLKSLIDELKINGESPSKALNQLSKELERLELRNNQLLYVILEGLMFFQLRQMVRIEHWKKKIWCTLRRMDSSRRKN